METRLLGILVAFASSVWATPITGSFQYVTSWQQWIFSGPGIYFNAGQGQTRYLFTVCYANQLCELSGSLPTFVNNDAGGSDLYYRRQHFTGWQVDGVFNWTAPMVKLPPAVIHEPFSMVLPVAVHGYLNAFEPFRFGTQVASFVFEGDGQMSVTSNGFSTDPGQFVGVIADGSFNGDLHATPEPATAMLCLAGILFAVVLRRLARDDTPVQRREFRERST